MTEFHVTSIADEKPIKTSEGALVPRPFSRYSHRHPPISIHRDIIDPRSYPFPRVFRSTSTSYHGFAISLSLRRADARYRGERNAAFRPARSCSKTVLTCAVCALGLSYSARARDPVSNGDDVALFAFDFERAFSALPPRSTLAGDALTIFVHARSRSSSSRAKDRRSIVECYRG